MLPQFRWAYSYIGTLVANQIAAGFGDQRFAPERPITREQLSFLVKKALPAAYDRAFARTPIDKQLLQRRELSRVLYEVWRVKLGIV